MEKLKKYSLDGALCGVPSPDGREGGKGEEGYLGPAQWADSAGLALSLFEPASCALTSESPKFTGAHGYRTRKGSLS